MNFLEALEVLISFPRQSDEYALARKHIFDIKDIGDIKNLKELEEIVSLAFGKISWPLSEGDFAKLNVFVDKTDTAQFNKILKILDILAKQSELRNRIADHFQEIVAKEPDELYTRPIIGVAITLSIANSSERT